MWCFTKSTSLAYRILSPALRTTEDEVLNNFSVAGIDLIDVCDDEHYTDEGQKPCNRTINVHSVK